MRDTEWECDGVVMVVEYCTTVKRDGRLEYERIFLVQREMPDRSQTHIEIQWKYRQN